MESTFDKFRPFFWVDKNFRISGWPDATANALRVSAAEAIGHHCWDVLFRDARRVPKQCRRHGHCHVNESENDAAALGTDSRLRCAILPLAGENHEAVVWLPFSRLAKGTTGSARLEGLVIRGALAESLGSIHATLESLRRICAADDCEMFLLDQPANEVVLVDCVGPDREAFLEKTRLPLGAGYPGAVTLQQRSLYTNRFESDRLFVRSGVKRCGLHSFLGVPLTQGGRPIGYIGVGWRDAHVPMEWGLRVLEEVRNLLPLAVPPRAPCETPPRLCGDSAPPLDANTLHLRCFGPFEIRRGNERIPLQSFTRRKALHLLKTLILMRGVPIHRDKLVEMLWPGAAREAGINRLHGVVSVLRSTLEAGRRARTSDYILRRDDYFLLNPEVPLAIDLVDFCETEAAARSALHQGDEERGIDLLDAATRLYRGDLFADDHDDDAIEAQRVHLRHLYLDVVRSLAPMKLRQGQSEDAVRVLRAALGIDATAVDLHEELIALLVRAGRHMEAQKQFDCCRIALREQLDMEPPARLRLLVKPPR